jgi:DNA-binding transcriptional LysR family regulator
MMKSCASDTSAKESVVIPTLPSLLARLRFRQLSVLIALEECGGLHKAAERLSMTQPGLSRALHEIESTFGVQLFVRSKSGVQPTELGRCLVQYARVFEADLGHLREHMNGVLQGSGGRVAVGAITGALHGLLVDSISQLRRSQPSVSVEVREGISLDLLSWIAEGRLDLAVCRTSVLSNTDQFDYEPLMEEIPAAAVGLGHPLAKAKRVTLAELAKYRWIVYPGNMPLRKLLEQEFRNAGLDLPSYPLETGSSLTTMLMLKEDDQLVALMASPTMDFCVEHGIARRLPIRFKTRHEAFGIATRRGARLSPAAKLLVDCLRQAAERRRQAQP